MTTEPLTQEQVLHLAKLARLELTPPEVELYTQQLGEVLGYVTKLQELDVPLDTVENQSVVLRADQVQEWPESPKLINAAPQHADAHVEVPAVFEDRA